MDSISPAQKLLYDFLLQIESGKSCLRAFKLAMSSAKGVVQAECRELLFQYESGKAFLVRSKTPELRKVIYEIIFQGLQGVPVQQRIESVIEDVEQSANADIDRFIARVPIYSLVIVLFFYFPAFMLLIMGPIVQELLNSLGG